MIKNLLNPKWQHPDAAIRRRAVEEGRLEADVLFKLAETDPDPGVRKLAVSRMQDLQQLIALVDARPDAADAGVPARLHDLILAADSQAVPDTRTLQRCCELCSDQRLRLSLLQKAPYAALRQMAAQGIDDNEALEQCVLKDKASEVRRAAVARIENEDSLRRIARDLRGHDKTTARLADDKRAQLQQRRETAALRADLLTQLQAYAVSEKPLNEAAIDKLNSQWRSVADGVDRELQGRFDAIQTTLQPRLEQHRRQLEQEREARSSRELVLQALTELAERAEQMEPAELEQRVAADMTRWRELPPMQNSSTQQHLQQDFDEALQRVKAITRQRRAHDDLQQRLESTIAYLNARLQATSLTAKDVNQAREKRDKLLGDVTDKQAFEKQLQRVRNLTDKLENKLAEQKDQEQALRDKLKTHVEALESALRDQTLRAALAAHKKAHDVLVAAGDNKPAALKNLEKRLHHCEPALRELKSWRNYGTDHAREELVKEAVALRDAPPEKVEKLARTLTDLRTRWKKLGPLEPGGKALWEQFDAACTQAHEPVKARHDAEADARRQHLEQRKAICKHVEDLVADTDWEQPDWHGLDKAMGEARRKWHKTGGVPHKAWPAIRKRFDKAIKDLDNRLAPERERNFEYRQRLVYKAEQLAQETDNRAATAAARELRQQWQVTVHSHSRKEKQLWQAFNKAMDLVFQKDRAARDQFMASLDENQHKAEALCEQLEQQSRADDTTVRNQHPDIQQAVDQFSALNLPRKTRKQLEHRFDRACKALKQRIASADDALRNAQLEQLYALHCLCTRLESLALGQQPDAQAASDIEAQWTKVTKPTKEKATLHSIERRYQTALAVLNGEQDSDALGDLLANADHKRTLCTDLEILLHLESPEAERGQRMQRQVELMENAMKGVDQDSPDRIRELRLAYLNCGPPDVESLAELEERFSKAFNASV